METIKIRVLQHDLGDNLRIGPQTTKSNDPETIKLVSDYVIKQYTKGLPLEQQEEHLSKYYRKLSIVNATTLKDIKVIFKNKSI